MHLLLGRRSARLLRQGQLVAKRPIEFGAPLRRGPSFVARVSRSSSGCDPLLPAPFLGPWQPVLARVGAALEQAEFDERRGISMSRAGAHADVARELDDPPLAAIVGEAHQD